MPASTIESALADYLRAAIPYDDIGIHVSHTAKPIPLDQSIILIESADLDNQVANIWLTKPTVTVSSPAIMGEEMLQTHQRACAAVSSALAAPGDPLSTAFARYPGITYTGIAGDGQSTAHDDDRWRTRYHLVLGCHYPVTA